MFTNVGVFREIAVEAWQRAQKATESHRTPIAGGSGQIVKFDPARTAFKQSLIAIAFSGIWFESFILVVATQRLGRDLAKQIDWKPYQERLQALGVTDAPILADARRFQESRKELVHEKAEENWPTRARYAQDEAKHAVEFIRGVEQLLAREAE